MSGKVKLPVQRLIFWSFFILFILIYHSPLQAAQVTLAWDPVTPTPDGYMVFQRLDGETYNYASPVCPEPGEDPTQTTCDVENLADGTLYHFVVRAYVGSNVSGDSNEEHHTTAPAAPTVYTITTESGSGGAISPQTTTVNAGQSQNFTITPHSGYGIADVVVDGQSVGSQTSYTFANVAAAHTLQAIFTPLTHVISASAGSNGSITPSGQIDTTNGENQTFTIAAHSGYRIADVVVDGVSTGARQSYTFSNVVAGHTIAAAFVADTYTIDASAGQGGTITPNGNLSVAGQSDLVFSVTPDEGYEIDDLIVDGVSMGGLDNHTFSAIGTDHTIRAAFRAIDPLPVADAGPDQVVNEQAFVSLNGLNSKDADDGIASFDWRQTNGTPVQLSSLSGEIVTFTAPDVDVNGEALAFELTVTDTNGNVSTDSCIVNVTWVNEAPLAQAGPDQSVNEGSTVVLSAADSMDPDDGIDYYEWRQVQGPEVVLNQPTTSSPSFNTPDVGPQGASLVFELTVTDAGGLQDTDRCTVSVTWDNMEPLADAGSDLMAMAGDTVELDATMSMDPDGLNLNYQWRQTFGPPVTLSDPTSDRPQFTVPTDEIDETTMLTFELTVTDSGGLSGSDTCHVTIDPYVEPIEDHVPPTLTIEKPVLDWAVVFTSRYKLSGSANDDQHLVKVEWENDRGGSGEVNGTTQWWKRIKLRRGLNVITITAVDAAGNQTMKKVHIYRFKWR